MSVESLTLDTIIIPMCGRILINKDDERKKTKGGIVLPDTITIPVITARVLAIAEDIKSEVLKYGELQEYDRVLVNPSNAIPVDLEQGNRLFIIPIQDVVAIFKKKEKEKLIQ